MCRAQASLPLWCACLQRQPEAPRSECQHHLVTPSLMTPQKQGHASRGHDPLGRLPSWTLGAVSQRARRGETGVWGLQVALLTPANPGHQSCAQKIEEATPGPRGVPEASGPWARVLLARP